MQLLEDHIRREGKVAAGNVLRVDGFLNHQIDVVLLTKLAPSPVPASSSKRHFRTAVTGSAGRGSAWRALPASLP